MSTVPAASRPLRGETRPVITTDSKWRCCATLPDGYVGGVEIPCPWAPDCTHVCVCWGSAVRHQHFYHRHDIGEATIDSPSHVQGVPSL